MYLLTLSDASLYISFLLDLENFPRGWILTDTFCLPGMGGGVSKPWPNTLIQNIAIKLNFPGIRGNPTTSLTTDIYTQICEWILSFVWRNLVCLRKLISFISSSQITIRSLHSSLLQRGSYTLGVVCDLALTSFSL